jgi:putative spermidine/putrescine transport system ATP-binding protein
MQSQPLTIDAVTHRYGATAAVDGVTLEMKAGELVALLGPSGCGKTTLLRIIAGFIRQTEGRVIVGGDVIDPLPPHRRTVGIVFQNYALFPHMSVAENVAYGLAARGAPRNEQQERVTEMLDLVKLGAMAERLPRQLSGGQQQRVALARALAVRPSILLLDEPFAALDKNLRLDMQIEIKRIQRAAGTTTVIVTHDQEEALSMADRVAVLNEGRLEQFDAATRVYDEPGSFFVNTFVGSANVLPCEIASASDGIAKVRLDGGGAMTGKLAAPLAPGSRARLCVRPEHLRFTDGEEGLSGLIEIGLPMGASLIHEVRLATGQAIKVAEARQAGAQPLPPGTPVRLKPVSPDAPRLHPTS